MRTQSVQPEGRSWIDAAPFRAHVLHVAESAGVPWPAVAVVSGVPLASVRTLLFGRRGRRQTRIGPQAAARLLNVGVTDLAGLRNGRVPAASTATRLRRLLAAGADPLLLARWCDLRNADLARLADGDVPACSRLTAALVLAAERSWATGRRPGRAAA
ncbi:MAG: hypothetical protein KBG85_00805 [Micropruina sp.]|nr:hypothetical protein [Micropruina sp.]